MSGVMRGCPWPAGSLPGPCGPLFVFAQSRGAGGPVQPDRHAANGKGRACRRSSRSRGRATSSMAGRCSSPRVFVADDLHTHHYIVTKSTAALPLTEEVVLGKQVWERNSCINCHTLHGEGAYFAPEVGNVTTRWGVYDDPDAAFEVMKGWMEAQPSGAEGRRQMPRFALSDEEIRGLSEFLRWADHMTRRTGRRTTRGGEEHEVSVPEGRARLFLRGDGACSRSRCSAGCSPAGSTSRRTRSPRRCPSTSCG